MPMIAFTVKLNKQLSLKSFDANNLKNLSLKTAKNKYQ